MKLHLVDVDADVLEAWRAYFAPFPEVDVQLGDILQMALAYAKWKERVD